MPIIRVAPGAPALFDAAGEFGHANEGASREFRFGWVGNPMPVEKVKAFVTEPKACMNEQWFSQMRHPLTVLYILVTGDDSPGPRLLDRKSSRNHLRLP